MRAGLPVIVALAGVVGVGVGAGLRLASTPGASSPPAPSTKGADGDSASAPADAASGNAKAQADKVHEKTKAKKEAGAGHKQQAETGTYFKFSRQFVAPVVREGDPEALIVLDVVLELSPESAESHYSIEPKLRDAVLRALLAQSGKGEIKGMLSDPSLLEATRDAILANVRDIIGDDARSVLLLDVAYQPF
jgi:hypothetical protein